MFVTNHVLAGALVGRLLARHPAGAFAAGVVSHLAMDACPHWGLPEGDGAADGAADGGRTSEFLRVARCDGCAGLAAMAVGAGLAPGRTRRAVVAGMAGGAVVDMDKPCEYFLGFNPFPRWFQDFHGRIQTESPDLMGRELAIAGALGTLMVGALARSRRG